MESETEKRDVDVRKKVGVILFVIAGLCLASVITIVLMFPDSFKGGNTVNTPAATTSPQIHYEQVNLQDMLDELDTNALRAEEKYKGKYIEITGEIRNFDSDGKYISIAPCGEGILSERFMCYLTDSYHKAFLLEKNVGDVVTIKGKVSSIGEVIGYHVQIEEISD